MRASLLFPLFLLAGFGAGIALFHSSAPLAAPSVASQRQEATEPAARPESLGGIAAQRLVSLALLKGDSFEREDQLYLAIESLTAEDFRRLAADPDALNALGKKLRELDQEALGKLASALIARWLAVDPTAALAGTMRVLELLPTNEVAHGMILDALAFKKPEELLALLSSKMDVPARKAIISRALRELAIRDTAKAQAWLNGCADPKDKLAGGQALRAGIVEASPLRAIELAGSIEDKEEGAALLHAAAERAAKMGPGMLRQLATTPMPQWMLGPVYDEIVGLDPELAVDLAVKSDAIKDLELLVDTGKAFFSLAQRDQPKAIAMLDKLSGVPRSMAVDAIGSVWIEREPEAAMNWLAQQPNPLGGVNEGGVVGFFHGWMRRSQDDARKWADALPLGEEREAVQKQLIQELAWSDRPAEAIQMLARLGDSRVPLDSVGNIASAWARVDPQAAAQWAVAQSPGPLQDRAIVSVVRTWANEQPHQVEEWLSQFPPGETRDRSILAYLDRETMSQASAKERGAEFNAWFDLIEDPWHRASVAVRQFKQIKQRDPAGARAWLSSLSNVDPEVIRKTLRDAK